MSIENHEALWQRWAEQMPSAAAFITPERTYTWDEVAVTVGSYARSLQQQGVNAGDVITLIGKNRPDWVWYFLGALHLGAATAFMAPQPLAKLTQKLQTIYRPEQQIWVMTSASDVDGLRRIYPALYDLTQTTENQAGEDGAEVSVPPLAYDPDRISSLIFTSGSTGTPKAVAHTSRQHCASARGLLAEFTFTPQDCWLLSLPLYHVSGLSILYRWLWAGGQLRIDKDFESAIQQVTHASLVPTQLQRLLDQPVVLSLTHVLLGGGEIPVALAQRAATLGIETWVGYGMTEAASTVTAKRIDARKGCGHVLAGRAIEIQDQRIHVRGETLARGYYRQGQLIPVVDEQGWFDTKDLGFWSDQELHIIGRADNLFISGGENIHCEEIERALQAHPAVEGVIVVPVADAEFGARPVAVMYCSAHQLPTQAEMALWLQGRIEKFKWPVAYYLMPATLLSQGIKVSRYDVKVWLSNQEKCPVTGY